jgi:hypothetical protein
MTNWLWDRCWSRKWLRHGESITMWRRKWYSIALWTNIDSITLWSDRCIVRRVRWRTSIAWVTEGFNVGMCQ